MVRLKQRYFSILAGMRWPILNGMEWDIPAIQARAGADIPRDFPRAAPSGNPSEYLHLPSLGWQEYPTPTPRESPEEAD